MSAFFTRSWAGTTSPERPAGSASIVVLSRSAFCRLANPESITIAESHQVFPLYLDIVPAQQTPTVVAALVNAIHNQSDHVNCGIIGRYEILAET